MTTSTSLEQRIQDYWETAPCGSWYSTHPIGSLEYFLELDDWSYKTSPCEQDLFVSYESWRDQRVLEMGCGAGFEAKKFIDHGARYVGIDLTSAAVQLVQQRFKVFDLDGEVYQCNAAQENLKEKFGVFDLVFSCGVMHHWPDVDGFVQNAWNCLKSDGQFIFMVYAKNSWDYAMYRAGLAQYEAQAGCPHVEVYDKEDIQNMLGTKFIINDIVQYGCFMYNVAEYRKKNIVLEPWFLAMPEPVRQAVDQQLGKYYMVRAFKRES